MARQLFSPSWHSVAELRPRLLPTARVQRQVFRSQVWYVVQDHSGGRYHRMTAGAYHLLTMMDGSKTVQEIWAAVNTDGHGDACTQGEVVELLVNLHAADLLTVDLNPDSAALFARFKKKRWTTIKQYLLNPMSIKFPLVDPEPFIRWAMPAFGWLFSPLGAVLWMLLVLPATVLAGLHWGELTHNLSDQLLSSSNLWVMVVVFPLVKLVHELGHGFAARAWGAPVREMGLMLLVFAPVPYVNASGSSIFESKYRRAIVAGAGMLAELMLAAVAMYVWLVTEPGLVRAVAYNVMVVAGVSTLIINGNPLLRYDAYYIFSDLIEMPNLAQRGNKYLTYLWDRYIYRSEEAEPPQETAAERRWLVVYTPLAWLYRTFITLTIIVFVAGEFFFFGVLLAIWAAITLIGTPVLKAYKHVTSAPHLERVRTGATRTVMGLVLAVIALLFVLPFPLNTVATGVVWLPEQSLLRAGAPGFFSAWNRQPGDVLKANEQVFRLDNPQLQADWMVAQARLDEAEAKLRSEQYQDVTKAALAARQLEEAAAVVRNLEERMKLLQGRTEVAGVLAAFRHEDMAGTYVRQGELLGYVLDDQKPIARFVVSQDDVDLLRRRLRGAQLRLSESLHEVHEVSRWSTPVAGVEELPSAALGLSAGGNIPTRPDDPQGVKTLQRVFLIDLELPANVRPAGFGGRAYARFDLGWEPLGWQGIRRLRQLFLGYFGV
ncbi:MAG: hypothetical protein U1E02_44115 [Hydrogenophaga sp.]|nr:hypothetical protein [Hydrogenophaga sp.]MDP3925191.1 hypothetical protein [Hydrogenophaga sp.]MDZ4131113.1 hypothetical protein [Hydrogenophaga sp.]MDZ4239526.1 hypothetical protein [Hydrogenophaga sp.]